MRYLNEWLEQRTGTANIERMLGELEEYYKRKKSELIQNTYPINRLAVFLKESISSPYSTLVLRTIFRLYIVIGFEVSFDIFGKPFLENGSHDSLFFALEYYRTYERVLDHKPKSLSKDFVDVTDLKDSTLDNPLLSFDVLHITLSMINSIGSKRATIQYRSLLKILFSILSIFSDDSIEIQKFP
jgi:hypothetical protein